MTKKDLHEPMTTEEVLARQDELADYFESDDFDGPVVEGEPLRALLAAVNQREAAQARVHEAVAVARSAGSSWNAIAAMLGVSRQAARQRYARVAGEGKPA
ncbi:MAG: hypothetical protein ACRD0A_09550 [Acidimicrobiales bacterium]